MTYKTGQMSVHAVSESCSSETAVLTLIKLGMYNVCSMDLKTKLIGGRILNFSR